jgi:hypothetical protein
MTDRSHSLHLIHQSPLAKLGSTTTPLASASHLRTGHPPLYETTPASTLSLSGVGRRLSPPLTGRPNTTGLLAALRTLSHRSALCCPACWLLSAISASTAAVWRSAKKTDSISAQETLMRQSPFLPLDVAWVFSITEPDSLFNNAVIRCAICMSGLLGLRERHSLNDTPLCSCPVVPFESLDRTQPVDGSG